MVRNYKKKRDKEIDENDITTAVSQVVNGHMKLSEAASAYNIKVNTLFYRIKRHKENVKLKSDDFTSKYTVAQIFNKYEEKMLSDYLLKSSKMNYGLTYKQAISLAYQYATALKKCPPQWAENKEAGRDWLKGFMKRHGELSLRKPENTSLSRSTSFNKHNVNQFLDNYAKILSKYKFEPDRIYNLDETNIMTVVQAPNIIAKKGTKQVAQAVSAERGQLITMCGIANAQGNTLPPVFIFPRARFHDSMLHGAPVGSIGYANSPTSGRMTGILFIKVLEHIEKHTRCTKDDPILILMDNHESHCTLEAINYSGENGIILLTFPPHCTHKMQPLDVAVNGPFKQKLAMAQNDWLLNNPGKTIKIHDLASIVTPAYNITYVTRNILSGFSKPGLYPFSRNAFCETVSVPSSSLLSNCDVLDQLTASTSRSVAPISTSIFPALDSQSAHTNNDLAMAFVPPLEICAPESARAYNANSFAFVPPPSRNSAQISIVSANTSIASVSVPFALASDTVPTRDDRAIPFDFPKLMDLTLSVINTNITVLHSAPSLHRSTPDSQNVITSGVSLTQTVDSVLTPEMVRPYPKAPARKESKKGRKKGKSRILTDTPEKQEIEAAYIDRMARVQKRKPSLKRKNANNKQGNSKNVCSKHFKSQDSVIQGPRNRLTANAVPSVLLTVCRVCLAMDVKMYDLKNIELREMFQNITGITVTQNNHSILERLCWECAGRLKAAAAFRHKALLSDALLQGLASTGEQIRKNDITLIKENKDYLKSTRTLSAVEVLHTVDIDPENDSITPLSENNDAEIVQNTVRKDSFELKQETIIDEENDQTDVKDESMIEAPIKTEMEYDQFDHICRPNTGEESSNAFIETNPLVSNYVNLEEDKINSADSSPLAGCSHVEPRYPIFGYFKKKPIDCEDKITKHVIITTNSISKIVSKDLKELISAKSKNINVKIGGVSKKTSNKILVKKN